MGFERSCFFLLRNLSLGKFRCYPRDSRVRIRSNQIRQHSTIIPLQSTTVPLLNPKVYNPWFITGFTDAEGSFIVSVSKYPGARSG